MSLDNISGVAVYGSSSETMYFVTRELERIMASADDATWASGIVDIVECPLVNNLLVSLC